MAVRYAVNTTPARLDPQSVAYLKDVERSRGIGQPGLYVPRQPGLFATPRSGWGFFLFLGLAALAAVGLITAVVVTDVQGDRLPRCEPIQAILLGIAAFFLLLGTVRFLRVLPPWQPKNFLYADANFVWEIAAGSVTAIPLSSLANVKGAQHTSNGAYSHSVITIEIAGMGGGFRSFIVSSKISAIQLMNFLQALIAIRSSTETHLRAIAQMPGFLGAAAKALAENKDLKEAMAEVPANPPIPSVVEPDRSIPQYGWGTAILRVACAILIGVGGFYGFTLLNNYLQDDAVFATVDLAGPEALAPLDRYLSNFPHGRHAQAVKDLRDDRRFAAAKRDSDAEASPARLRDYLADASNVRHRPEAQQMISGYYDKVIADLKGRQSDPNGKVDPKLLAGILGLLEGLKTADRPVVTVGFTGDADPAPQLQDTKDLEDAVYNLRVEKEPELKRIASGAAGGSAIIQPVEVFQPDRMKQREAMIIGRLRDAVQKGINAEILTLEPAGPGVRPSLEVSYHIAPDGGLYLYTSTEENRKSVKGLLRKYEIAWSIKFRPLGDHPPIQYTLTSIPGSQLHYDSSPQDPDWGVYAVILYSGFYDMSAQLIKGFGQDPGPAPDNFSFNDALGTYHEEVVPARADLPGLLPSHRPNWLRPSDSGTTPPGLDHDWTRLPDSKQTP